MVLVENSIVDLIELLVCAVCSAVAAHRLPWGGWQV